MTDSAMVPSSDTPTFTRKDRDVIRLFFIDLPGAAVSIHDGFWLRRWASGVNKGQPKIQPAVQSMIARGLVTVVDDGARLPRALFTDAGFRALVEMANDAQAFRPPERYSHLLAEIAELRGTLSQNAG